MFVEKYPIFVEKYSFFTPLPSQTVCVWGGGGGGGGGGWGGRGRDTVFTLSVHICPPVTFWWFLPLNLLNDLRILFIFCINVDIDKMLLLDKNKGIGINSFRVIPLCNFLKRRFGFCFIAC